MKMVNLKLAFFGLILLILGIMIVNYMPSLYEPAQNVNTAKAKPEIKLNYSKPPINNSPQNNDSFDFSNSQKTLSSNSGKNKEIERLIKELVSENLEVSQKAADSLLALGKTSIPELEKTRRTADTGLKGQIVFLLGRMGYKETLPFLEETLKDDNAYIRKNSAEALGKIKNEQSVFPLEDSLFDEDIGVRERSAWALGEIKNTAAVEDLLDRIRDEKEERVKSSVVNALGKLNDSRATATLLAELKAQNDYSYKNEVAAVLGQVGDQTALAGLTEYLNALKQYNPGEKMVILQWEQTIKIAEEAIQKVKNKIQ